MIPYNKYDLQKIFHNKKIDIFQYNTIGWLEDQQKYILIGGLEPIENIINKYGNIQIHQVYIFDKANPYQKQYLTKKMKIFQKIGYVFQKKLQQSTKYSIRFIIKMPIKIVKQKLITKPCIYSQISNIQSNKQFLIKQQIYKSKYSISYLSSRYIKNNFQDQSIKNLLQQSNHYKESIKKQLQYGLYKNLYKNINIDQINDNIIQMKLYIPFQYFRTINKGFYLANFIQYQYQNSHYYVSYIEEGLAIVVHNTIQSLVSLDYIIFNTIESVNKGSKINQIDLCLPIWTYKNSTFIEQGPVRFNHSQKLKIDLNFGSIASTFMLKHQYIEIRPPFIVFYCETKQKLLRRPLGGSVITEQNIIYQNLR